MKIKPTYIFLFILLLMSLNACKTINNGVIVKKKFFKTRTLYASGVYNQTENRYQLIIEGKNKKQKVKKSKVYVSKQTFDRLIVGDFYPKNDNIKEP